MRMAKVISPKASFFYKDQRDKREMGSMGTPLGCGVVAYHRFS